MGADCPVDFPLTEEDARAAVVRGLVDRGIPPAQIRLEATFPIRVGHLARDVDGSPLAQDGTLRPRCDLLLLVNGNVVAIVEVKKPGHAFTDDDREQALSYACISRPMAPLTFLTDGERWECLLTATRSPYAADFATAILQLADGSPLPESIVPRPADFLRSLRWFVNVDSANCRDFSTAQIAFRSHGLVAPQGATPQEAVGRYKLIPDVYISRDTANGTVRRFLADDTSLVLPVLSDAGVGKTSFLLDQCGALSTEHIVFFLNGALLSSHPIAALREDVSWEGVAVADDPSLLADLASLLTGTGRILIVVDAIDESPRETLARDLDDLVGRLKRFRGKIKLIVACKPMEWSRFSTIAGVTSRLESASFDVKGGTFGSPTALSGLRLQRFTDSELEQALTRLSTWIGRDLGPLPEDLYEACRTPYFLHMLARIRLDTEHWPPPQLSTNLHSLFFSDIARRVDPEGRPEWSETMLIRVAERCWQVSSAGIQQPADITDLRQGVADERRLLGLFDRGILQGNLQSASFYFQPFFLWIVSERILRLASLTASEFDSLAQSTGHSTMGGELLHQYLSRAPAHQVGALYGTMEGRARIYLATRDDVVRRHFTGISHMLEPFTEKPGMLLAPSGEFGFFQRRPGDPPVVITESLYPDVPEGFADRVTSIRSQFPGWQSLDPEACATTDLFEDIKRIADQGAWQTETKASLEELVRALWRCLTRAFRSQDCVDVQRPLPRLDVRRLVEHAVRWIAYEHFETGGIREALGFHPVFILRYQGGLVAVPKQHEDRRHLSTAQLDAIAKRAAEQAEAAVQERSVFAPTSKKAEACAMLFRACAMYPGSEIPEERASAYKHKITGEVEMGAVEVEEIAAAAHGLISEIGRDAFPNLRRHIGWGRATKLYCSGRRYEGDLDFEVVTYRDQGGIEVTTGAAPAIDWNVQLSWTRRSFERWAYEYSIRDAASLWAPGRVDESIKGFRDYTPIRNVAHGYVKDVWEKFMRRRERDERLVIATLAREPRLRASTPFAKLCRQSFLDRHNRDVWRHLEQEVNERSVGAVGTLERMLDDKALMLGTREAIRAILQSREMHSGEAQEAVGRVIALQEALECRAEGS